MADIVPNEELRSFLIRFYDAWSANDWDAVRDMVSSGAHVVILGTDPGECGLGAFRFGEPRRTTLKGLDGTFEVYPVAG